jgi:tripartite-type tricarboxylate transporter receptor subunit TctC
MTRPNGSGQQIGNNSAVASRRNGPFSLLRARVPYRGGGPALQDLVAGHIDLMIEPTSNFAHYIPSGAVKPYAVAARTRVSAAPQVATVDEAGLPGFYASLWLGLWLPKGTPKDVITKLNGAVIEALTDPAVRQRLADIGQSVPPREQQTPEALGAFQKAEIEKWWPIIKAANIKAECPRGWIFQRHIPRTRAARQPG